MKKLLLILLCLPLLFTTCKKEDNSTPNSGSNSMTYIPDDNFEQALIDLGHDSLLDGYVITASIDTVTYLNVNNKQISDLTGVEKFIALTTLHCANNQFTTLDLTKNTALTMLDASFNQLSSLNISKNIALIYFACGESNISALDLSNNTALTNLDVWETNLIELDLSNNSELERIECYNNQLTSVDLRNGNNTNIDQSHMLTLYGNPNLTCINVDDSTWSANNWLSIDPQHYFSEQCP